jgi:plasmid maintenance system antidote protein VapI
MQSTNSNTPEYGKISSTSKSIEAETTQAKLAEDVGTTPSYVNRLIKKNENIVNKTFIQMLESLGYDIELTYVKREEE